MSGILKSARAFPSFGEIVRAASHLSTWLALTLLGVVWIGTHLYLELDQRKSIEAAITETANMARVFDENVASSIKDIDKTLLFLRHAYEADPVGFDLPAWTTNVYLLRDLTIQVALIGADGRLVATNVARNAEAMDLSDREHFRVHLGTTDDQLFISKPVLGRATGKWTIQLTRRVSKPDGSFGGVIVASLDPFHLSRFFEQIDLGKEGAITLIGTDGVIRARGGLKPELLGRSIVGTRLFDTLSRSGQGLFHDAATFTGGRRLVSFRHMKDFPLIVAVAEAESEVLSGLEEKQALFLWTATGSSLVLLIVMFIGISHEIGLERARAAAIDSENRVFRKSQELKTTLRRMSQGIVMLDGDGRLRIINQRAIAFLGAGDGFTVGQALPERVATLLGTEHGDEESHREVLLADATEIELVTAAMPDGGTLFTLTDITARKHNEAAIADARDRAEAAARTRTAFLATMSHELRTPLNGVVGMTRLLEGCEDATERSLYVQTMRNSAEHLLQIIDDILDVTKLEADRMTFETSPFDVAATVRATTDIVAPKACEKGLAIETTIAPDMPPRLIGDAGRVRQVLLNLLSNAVKFTETGRITVTVDLARPARDGDVARLRLRIRDTGIGIAAESLHGLFKEFSQLDGSITRRFGGTGLGLAISRKLVEKMGGEITVSSTLGEGSTFTVELPAPVAPAEPVVAAAAAVELAPEVRTLDILLAEDNPTNTLVATRLLQKLGHRVTAVVDGVAALEVLAVHRFDVVLMDVMMPRMDGLTATRRIRDGEAASRDVPIVALTANALAEDRDAALAAGADAFASKPVSLERLKDAITEALTARRARPAAAEPAAASPASERPSFDPAMMASLIETLGDGEARQIIDLFFADTAVRIDLLRHLVEDRPALVIEAHAIKASAATLGLVSLAAEAAGLEQAARRLDGPALIGSIEVLAVEFERARALPWAA